MADYRADMRDIRFQLFEVLKIQDLQKFPRYQDYGKDEYEAVINEAYKFAREVLAPMNEVSDQVGAKFENGQVIHTKTKPRAAAELFSYRWFRAARPTDGVHPIGSIANVSRFVYVRVTQTDGHLAWSSPIWLDFCYDE